MDELIMAIYKALGVEGNTVAMIHDACIAKGWSEEDTFLAIQAGLNLYNASIKQTEELASSGH